MTVYARAHVFRNAILTLGGTSYVNQVNKARLVPETPIQQMRTLIPDGVIIDIDSTAWTLELGGVQDFGTGSLGKAISDAAGSQLALVLQPKSGSVQDTVSCQILCLPIEFGGEQGNFRVFDTELPVIGQPVITQSA